MRQALWGLVVLAGLVGALFFYRGYLANELRKPVLAQLKDPESAVFRNETVYGQWLPSKTVMCGEFNAKNGMGGYAGFRPYFATEGVAETGLDGDLVRAGCENVRRELPWWAIRW